MKKNSIFKVYLAAILYSCIIGFSFVFTKYALEFNNPIDILGHRFLASAIGLIIFLKFKNIDLNLNKSDILKILPLAIVYPLLFFTLQTFGLKHSTSSEGGILLATAPIFTLILSEIFLKEKTTLVQKLSVLLSVSGVVFIFYMKSTGSQAFEKNILGIVLLTLTAVCFAVYSVLARNFSKKYSNIQLITVMIIISFIAFNILSLGKNIIYGNISDYFIPFKYPKYILAIFYLGVLSTLVSSMLTNFVLANLEASKMSVFANLGTLISIFAGAILLSEDIFYYHIVGAIFIILGVLGTNYKKRGV